MRGLGVQRHECVFVGDGGSFELTGAAELGMEVHRFRAPNNDEGDSIDKDEGWTGRTFTDLTDLVAATSS